MRRRLTLALPIACAVAAIFAGAQHGSARPLLPVPEGFFGIAPQTALTDADAAYMKAGGIETVRWPLLISDVQRTRRGGYDWRVFDPVVEVAARHGLRILPVLSSTPRWLARKPTTLPIDSATARKAWAAFLQAAVKRYGPGGEFWREQEADVIQYEPAVPEVPIRTWQIWNEANFFYFAYPASPRRYARLLRIASPAIKAVDPGATVLLSGLFGRPTAGGARGMDATKFLEALYRSGMKSRFDAVALHPYAVDAETLLEIVEELHRVTVKHHDRVPLYIT
jgi:polysaccharide biosynthesis protein PslG